MKASNMLGEGIIAAVLTFLVINGTDFSTFIHFPSMVFVVGVIVGSLLFKHGTEGLALFIGTTEYERRKEIVKTGVKATFTAGALGFFIGLVQLLSNLSDPTKVGPALAVSLLTVIYSLVIYLIIFLPLPALPDEKTSEIEEKED